MIIKVLFLSCKREFSWVVDESERKSERRLKVEDGVELKVEDGVVIPDNSYP